MLYALMKTAHLLSIIAWVGGMFFTLHCLRPAAMATLDGPQRVRLMHATMARFFKVVLAAAALVLVSGGWMINQAAAATASAGAGFNMPLDWYVMTVLGVLMIAIFGHIRYVLFRRLTHAVDAQAWPTGAAVLGSIRNWVMANLALGVVIVVATQVGSLG
jgi:uncharacterized membrane protein